MASFHMNLNLSGMASMGETLNSRSVAVEEAKNAAIDAVAQRLTETAQAYSIAGHPDFPEEISQTLYQSLWWEHTGDGSAVVFTKLDYAYWVEFGHEPSGWYANMTSATFVPAYPFFRPAITQVIDGGEAQQIITEHLQAAVQNADGGGGASEGGEINAAVPSDISVAADL